MRYSVFLLFAASLFIFSACDHTEEYHDVDDMMEDSVESVEMEVEVEGGDAVEMEVEVEDEAAGTSRYIAFDQSAYDAALEEGKTVFLDFHADWCSTCVSNQPKIQAAFDSLGDDEVIGFKVDYDTAEDLKKEYSVFSQSTLVVVPGGDKSAARTTVGLVTEDSVLEFIQG